MYDVEVAETFQVQNLRVECFEFDGSASNTEHQVWTFENTTITEKDQKLVGNTTSNLDNAEEESNVFYNASKPYQRYCGEKPLIREDTINPIDESINNVECTPFEGLFFRNNDDEPQENKCDDPDDEGLLFTKHQDELHSQEKGEKRDCGDELSYRQTNKRINEKVKDLVDIYMSSRKTIKQDALVEDNQHTRLYKGAVVDKHLDFSKWNSKAERSDQKEDNKHDNADCENNEIKVNALIINATEAEYDVGTNICVDKNPNEHTDDERDNIQQDNYGIVAYRRTIEPSITSQNCHQNKNSRRQVEPLNIYTKNSDTDLKNAGGDCYVSINDNDVVYEQSSDFCTNIMDEIISRSRSLTFSDSTISDDEDVDGVGDGFGDFSSGESAISMEIKTDQIMMDTLDSKELELHNMKVTTEVFSEYLQEFNISTINYDEKEALNIESSLSRNQYEEDQNRDLGELVRVRKNSVDPPVIALSEEYKQGEGLFLELIEKEQIPEHLTMQQYLKLILDDHDLGIENRERINTYLLLNHYGSSKANKIVSTILNQIPYFIDIAPSLVPDSSFKQEDNELDQSNPLYTHTFMDDRYFLEREYVSPQKINRELPSTSSNVLDVVNSSSCEFKSDRFEFNRDRKLFKDLKMITLNLQLDLKEKDGIVLPDYITKTEDLKNQSTISYKVAGENYYEELFVLYENRKRSDDKYSDQKKSEEVIEREIQTTKYDNITCKGVHPHCDLPRTELPLADCPYCFLSKLSEVMIDGLKDEIHEVVYRDEVDVISLAKLISQDQENKKKQTLKIETEVSEALLNVDNNNCKQISTDDENGELVHVLEATSNTQNISEVYTVQEVVQEKEIEIGNKRNTSNTGNIAKRFTIQDKEEVEEEEFVELFHQLQETCAHQMTSSPMKLTSYQSESSGSFEEAEKSNSTSNPFLMDISRKNKLLQDETEDSSSEIIAQSVCKNPFNKDIFDKYLLQFDMSLSSSMSDQNTLSCGAGDIEDDCENGDILLSSRTVNSDSPDFFDYLSSSNNYHEDAIPIDNVSSFSTNDYYSSISMNLELGNVDQPKPLTAAAPTQENICSAQQGRIITEKQTGGSQKPSLLSRDCDGSLNIVNKVVFDCIDQKLFNDKVDETNVKLQSAFRYMDRYFKEKRITDKLYTKPKHETNDGINYAGGFMIQSGSERQNDMSKERHKSKDLDTASGTVASSINDGHSKKRLSLTNSAEKAMKTLNKLNDKLAEVDSEENLQHAKKSDENKNNRKASHTLFVDGLNKNLENLFDGYVHVDKNSNAMIINDFVDEEIHDNVCKTVSRETFSSEGTYQNSVSISNC